MIEPYILIVESEIESVLSTLHSPLSTIAGASVGAVVEFCGVVRDTQDDQPIEGFEYEAFREMALAELRRIALEVIERFGLTDLVCVHRIGFVPVHEAAVYVRTAARHRREAFEANMEFIEQLKRRVPIWKHPVGKI